MVYNVLHRFILNSGQWRHDTETRAWEKKTMATLISVSKFTKLYHIYSLGFDKTSIYLIKIVCDWFRGLIFASNW